MRKALAFRPSSQVKVELWSNFDFRRQFVRRRFEIVVVLAKF
jgi:hypothetical protein